VGPVEEPGPQADTREVIILRAPMTLFMRPKKRDEMLSTNVSFADEKLT